jgi:biotin transport system substrate-specific component
MGDHYLVNGQNVWTSYAVSAKVQIPFWPVPMTMQTFVVLVIGMAYGARLGAATVGLYLAQGAIGLPVFATGTWYLKR